MARDPYTEKLEALYTVPDDVVAQNLEVMKSQAGAVPVPSQEDVDDAITGHPKARAARKVAVAAKLREDEVKKEVTAEKPAATYKVRTVTPETK